MVVNDLLPISNSLHPTSILCIQHDRRGDIFQPGITVTNVVKKDLSHAPGSSDHLSHSITQFLPITTMARNGAMHKRNHQCNGEMHHVTTTG